MRGRTAYCAADEAGWGLCGSQCLDCHDLIEQLAGPMGRVMEQPNMPTLTHAHLVAIFAEWDRRAIEEEWGDNPFDAAASARCFATIARDLFPELF